MSTAVHGELSDSQHRGMLVRAVIASAIGTSIEWYDFFLYSIVTGTVFAKQFFPNVDPLIGTLNAFLSMPLGLWLDRWEPRFSVTLVTGSVARGRLSLPFF